MALGFTQLSIKALKAEGFHRDGAVRGLYIQVTRSPKGGVTKSWLYRFTSPVTRKERWMGLGPCEVIGLAEARELAKAARRLVVLGQSSIAERQSSTSVRRGPASRSAA